MPQTDYSIYQAKGLEGLLGSTATTKIRPLWNPSTTVTLPFGRIVVKAAGGDNGVALPTAITGETVMGVIVASKIYEKAADGSAGVKPLNAGNLLLEGEVLMLVEQNVTPTSPVFYRAAAQGTPGTFDGIGRLRVDVNVDKAVSLPGARFLETAAAGTLCRVAFNLV